MESHCWSGETGCPGGTQPEEVVVDPVEDQAMAIGSPNEGIPNMSVGYQPAKSPSEVLLMSM